MLSFIKNYEQSSFSLMFHNFFLMETSNRFLNQRRDVDIKQWIPLTILDHQFLFLIG